MHTTKLINGGLALGSAIAIALAWPAHSQTYLNFNGASVTAEGAIRLSWNSATNEYYEIDYADSLVDINTGLITWKLLYEDYPSQGTSTFWLDTGNYFLDPAAQHPANTGMRFYRVAFSGTNTAPAPSVAITSPTNGFSARGSVTVTVSASSDQPFLSTKLYVDGQEMQEASNRTDYVANGTNYVLETYLLNTCEWPNGPHTLFATAESESGPGGLHDVPAALIGRAVSAFVGVNYDNLITRIAFSQPFFMPEDGQTQRVSAVFTANADWSLQIQDSSSNTVRTVTGSGGSMVFNWDGTGSGGTGLPVGNYTYLFSAQTNGQPLIQQGPGGSTNPPPAPGSSVALSEGATTAESSYPTSAEQAMAAGWEFYYLQPPPLPPVRTNGVWMSWEDVYGPQPMIPMPVAPVAQRLASALAGSTASAGIGVQTAQGGGGILAYSGPSSQATRAPVRPPASPVRGRAGVFGVAYDTYRGVASGYTVVNPDNGLHINQRIGMEGWPRSDYFNWPVLWGSIREARGFINSMKRGSWAMGFDRFDDALSIDDLRGSGANIFNQVKVGLLLLHGTFGTDQDFTANACQQMYFPVTSGPSAQYLRMSELNLGSADPNGLKWMAIDACWSLYHVNWANMQFYGVQPNNSNLHLLLGTDSVVWTDKNIMVYWAQYMTVGKTNGPAMTVQNAWYTAARDAYARTGFNYTNAMLFAAAGDTACQNDTLQTNSAPTGLEFYNNPQVWP